MIPPRIDFVVYGLPAPQGSKRFMGVHGGRGVLVESSKRVKPWREDVRQAAMAAMARRCAEEVAMGEIRATLLPLDAPLRVCMTFTLPKPASAPKRRKTWPMRTPDLSKLVRSTEDALTSAGLWRDDARVVECLARKVYPLEHPDALPSPGVRIRVEVIS